MGYWPSRGLPPLWAVDANGRITPAGSRFLAAGAILEDASSGTLMLSARQLADANKRWNLYASGRQEWGDGAAAPDMAVYRSGGNMLWDGTQALGLTHSFRNLGSGNGAHATVVIDKGADGAAASLSYYSNRVQFWDVGMLDDTAYTIRGGSTKLLSMAATGIMQMLGTTGAFIPSKLTTTQRDALTAVDGMMVYNTTTGALNYRKAGAWVAV